jgi:hypothetical protein
MATPASAPSATEAAKPKIPRTRVPTENRYPVYDLNSCLELAKAVQEQGGNACNPQQLGAFLNYTNTSGGGFVARVAATKQFGLITSVNGLYQTTPRAQAILYPVTREAAQMALVEAFLAIPLYKLIYERHRGVRLPEEFGMRNLMTTSYHVPSGERAARAYKVMMDSATQAGFFTATKGQRSHLIEPIIGQGSTATVEPESSMPDSSDGGDDGDGGSFSGESDQRGTRGRRNDAQDQPNFDLSHLHPTLRGLLLDVPPRGKPWPDRKKWDEVWRSNVDYLYGHPPEGEAT